MSSPGRPARFTAVAGDATRAVEITELGDGRWEVRVDGRTRVVDSRQAGAATFSLLIEHRSTEASVLARGEDYAVEIGGRLHRLKLLDERAMRRGARAGSLTGSREVRATMPGKVIAVLIEVGATVTRGQGLLVIEAMKMENEIAAPRDGVVREIRVKPGQAVESGELLAVVE